MLSLCEVWYQGESGTDAIFGYIANLADVCYLGVWVSSEFAILPWLAPQIACEKVFAEEWVSNEFEILSCAPIVNKETGRLQPRIRDPLGSLRGISEETNGYR